MVRLTQSQSLLDLKNSNQFEAPATGPGPGGYRGGEHASAIETRLRPSGRSLIALDLSVKPERALSTTAMPMHRGRGDRSFDTLSIQAKRVSPTRLVDNNGHDYRLGPVFSHGSFGAVRTLLKKDDVVDQLYVAKEINISGRLGDASDVPHSSHSLVLRASSLASLRREVNALIRFDSPLAPHAIFLTPDRAYLLGARMEGDLFSLASQIVHVPLYRRELAHAILLRGSQQLIPMHANDYAHRDIKLENFLYERSGEIVLYDFGLISHGSSNQSVAGTPVYMPFEALASKGGHPYAYQAQAADMWSLATTSMRVLTGEHFTSALFDSLDYEDMLDPASKPLVETKFSDYRTTYDLYARRLSRQQLGESDAWKADRSPHLSRRFLQLHDEYPTLFPILLAMLHYDPAQRPSPSQVHERALAVGPYNHAVMQGLVRADTAAASGASFGARIATVGPHEPKMGSLPGDRRAAWEKMGAPDYLQIKARLFKPIKQLSRLAQSISSGNLVPKKATFVITDSSTFGDPPSDASTDSSSDSSG